MGNDGVRESPREKQHLSERTEMAKIEVEEHRGG